MTSGMQRRLAQVPQRREDAEQQDADEDAHQAQQQQLARLAEPADFVGDVFRVERVRGVSW